MTHKQYMKLALEWRKRLMLLDITQTAFAEHSGVALPQLNKYLKCRGGAPRQATIGHINYWLREMEYVMSLPKKQLKEVK